jgi:maltose-binding protein MalE
MSTRKFSRREFLQGASLLAVSSVIVACGGEDATSSPQSAGDEVPAPTTAPVEEEGGVVQYWVNWGAKYASVWDELKQTEEFKQAIGNHQLEVKNSVGSEALLTAVAGGTPPDGAANIQYLDYMARGVLLPIDDWAAASPLIKKENYLEDSWNIAFYQGTMYGVPANEGFLRYGLYYNVRLVEEAGLDPDTPPVTWPEAMEWHQALTTFDDAGNLLQIGLDPYDAMGEGLWISDGFYDAMAWGFDWFDAEAGTFNLDNEMMADAMETKGEFIRYIGPDNLVGMRQVEGQGTWGGSYNAEVQAMMIDGYWRAGDTMTSKPEVGEVTRASWSLVPEGRSGVKVQAVGGHVVVFFKEAQFPEPMFRIAEFMNTNTCCDALYEVHGWLPGLRPYLETVDPSVYPGLEFFFRSMDETTDWHEIARCPITEFVDTQYHELYERVYRDEMTGAEAAAELQRRSEEEYEAAGFKS